MSRIDIRRFGGIAPSVDPRNLPAGASQIAQDLNLAFGDFRPTRGNGSSVGSVTSGDLAVHRTPSGTWLRSATDANFVNGQINDSSVERVFVTGRSAYPEAWQSGSYRRLGVRSPTAAPGVTHNVEDEYTDEEQRASVNSWVQDIKTAVLTNLTTGLIANGTPTTGALGAVWLDHGDESPMPTTLSSQIVYAVPMTSGAATATSDQYLLDPMLHGMEITHSAASYWAIPITWRPYGYDVDEAALSTEIKTFLKPPELTDQLVPDAVADQIAARVARIADPTLDPLAFLVSRVNAAQNDVATFLTREVTDATRVYALSDLLQRLASAIRAVDAYFVAWETQLGIVLNDYEYLIPPAVERVVETRSYYYTYVTDWDEESAPSPASALIELDQNDTATVTVVAPPSVAGYGSTTHWRLYRSSTTDTGQAFQFVAETAIGTLTYTDSLMQEELGEVCPTITWSEPPADLLCLSGGANGIMLGASGKMLCACEAFTPYAWPEEYRKALEYEIVAIVSTGQSWIVLTEGEPYLVSGADSANLSAQKLNRPQACVSKRSAAGFAGGAMFVSPDGLCLADTSGCTVVTKDAADKEFWASLTPSASFGAFSEGVYYLWLTTYGHRVTFDLASASISSSPATGASAAYVDLLTDTIYTVVSGALLPLGGGSVATGIWHSPILIDDSEPSFSWLRVVGDFTTATVRVYADGALVATKVVTTSAAVRMPAVRGREWEVEVESAGPKITRVTLASSTSEIR